MKSVNLISATCFLLGLMAVACTKSNEIIDNELDLVGEWTYEYTIREDGSRDYDNPNALFDYNYGDGFILNDNHTGHSVWYDEINGDFEWLSTDSKLTISVWRFDKGIAEFEFELSNRTNSSMILDTPKGNRYLLHKK